MASPIRLIASDANDQGDLLSRLARDLFFTFGYDNCRINIHKTGREIDLMAQHRFEPRNACAELKSTAATIGGADINKFVGVLDAERRKAQGREVHGYFVSLSGFKESAIEQERELDNSRAVLLDGSQVREELIKSGIVVSPASAALAAKDLVPPSSQLKIEKTQDLLGHDIGWIWAVYLTEHRDRRGLCLVHADGTPLSLTQTRQVIGTAKISGDPIAELKIFNKNSRMKDASTVARKYRAYMLEEFGGITLEGLPADQSVGSGQFKLESLYVPLRLTEKSKDQDRISASADTIISAADEPSARKTTDGSNRSHSWSLGEGLEKHSHLAILGLPGSGKSTALKRLAVAYSDRKRLNDSDDGLPIAPWFPVVIRCRHLGARARDPILQIIVDQVERAEMPEFREAFGDVVATSLREGRLLLLVDGLDEIPSPSDRVAFVSQLRTFVGVYPTCRLVVTSREAGFRSVATAVNSICHSTMVEELGDAAITSIVRSWHREVVGTSDREQANANRLAEDILANDRVRSLATNPLLLTTLLLVQRWIGQLPRRRSVLYQKAIEVLLMTWNAEGHQPIDPDEALPQLAYTAYSMMARGQTSLTSDELVELLLSSRNDLPEILSYAQMSPYEFVDRVEERSSLMTLSGHQVVDGKLKETYEFKHLTFQEYLAALGIANGWLEADLRGEDIASVIADRLASETWQEVVGLTAVLSGSRAANIVESLMARLKEAEPPKQRDRRFTIEHSQLHMNLIGCLRDEAAIAPVLATKAIEMCVESSVSSPNSETALSDGLHGGRYDQLLREIAHKKFKLNNASVASYGGIIGRIALLDAETDVSKRSVADHIAGLIKSSDESARISGLLGLMELAYHAETSERLSSRSVDVDREALLPLIDNVAYGITKDPSKTNIEAFAKVWCLAWGLRVDGRKCTRAQENELQLRLADIWMGSNRTVLSRQAAWALTSTSFVGRWNVSVDRGRELRAFAEKESRARAESSRFRRAGALVIRRYLEGQTERKSLIADIVDFHKGEGQLVGDVTTRLLDSLGPEGKRTSAALRRGRSMRRP